MDVNQITGAIINAAMYVHSTLGPGLLEEPYKQCLAYELQTRGFDVELEVDIPVVYRNVTLNTGYRADLLVQNQVLVELKSVKILAPIHRAQLLTYLKLSNKQIGLLLNFNTVNLRDGIVRIINTHDDLMLKLF